MSKKYKGKQCVYCVKGVSAVPDHVFAREFFVPDQRANLPKVPACHACNDEKGRLEHYLTAVLGFGGRHPDAITNLSGLVPPRLAKNAALHRRLSKGQRRTWSREGSLLVPVTTLPIDGEKIGQLFRFIVKGLMWHHWKVLIGRDTGVWAGCLTRRGVEVHRLLLSKNVRDRAKGNLGDGTFTYEGAQGTDIPDMSIWLFSIYGGITLSEGSSGPDDVTSFVGGVTATRQTLAKLDAPGITSPPGQHSPPGSGPMIRLG
jgi:hypothetical protein